MHIEVLVIFYWYNSFITFWFSEIEAEDVPEVATANTITKNTLGIEIVIDTGNQHTRAQDTRKIWFLLRINSTRNPRKFSNSWWIIRSYHHWRIDYGNTYRKKTLYQVRVSLGDVLDSFYFFSLVEHEGRKTCVYSVSFNLCHNGVRYEIWVNLGLFLHVNIFFVCVCDAVLLKMCNYFIQIVSTEYSFTTGIFWYWGN